ncbi:unnamed protein product [Amaranthus hypochondriacus]
MENCIHEDELRRLRSLVVKLAKELDYKNFKLIELEQKNALELQNCMKHKEKCRSERSAAISVLVSENVDKEILLDQMSAQIGSLKREKEQMLFKTSGSMNALKEENERLRKEKEWLLNESLTCMNAWKVERESLVNEKAAVISTLMELKEENKMTMEDKSLAISKLMAEKDQSLEAFEKGSTQTRNMKQEIEKMKHPMESQKEKLERLMKDRVQLVQEMENSTGIQMVVECCFEPEMGVQCQELKDSKLKLENVEDLRTEINNLRKEVRESAELLENLEMNNQFLTVKEIKSNHELQAARKAAIEGLLAMQSLKMSVGIKIMGEIKRKSFRDACSKRLRSGKWDMKFGGWEEKSVELCATWQNNISDPEWQPFKREIIDEKLTEVIDENDQRLKELKEEWGNETYTAVVEALLQVNENNASGRYPVAELWNYKENRKASLDEVIKYVIKQWRTHKKRKFFA